MSDTNTLCKYVAMGISCSYLIAIEESIVQLVSVFDIKALICDITT
jgi:hypothetical protein